MDIIFIFVTFLQQDYVSLLLATIASMVLGFLWYGPLFGGPWRKLSDFDKKAPLKMTNLQMFKTYGLSSVASFIMASVLNIGLNAFGVGVIDSALLAVVVLIWLGFIATSMVTAVLYDGKPWRLFLINTGYQLVSLVVMALVLVLV